MIKDDDHLLLFLNAKNEPCIEANFSVWNVHVSKDCCVNTCSQSVLDFFASLQQKVILSETVV